MSLSGSKCTRLVLIFCNVLFSWISGGLLVLFGGASLYDPSYIQFHTLLTLDKVPQYVFILFALSIIALGGFIITLGLFGCFGTLCDNNCIIKTYVYLLLFVFIAELGLGVGSLYLFFMFPTVSPELKDSLVEKLKIDFGYPSQLTFNTAVHFTQKELHCCGFNNFKDFEQSNWKSLAHNHDLRIPLTCCSSTPISLRNQTFTDSFGDEGDYGGGGEVTFAPSSTESSSQWLQKCQSAHTVEADDYLYDQGCWELVEDIYRQHVLFTSILFLSLALLQLVGVIFPICWLRRTEKNSRDIRIRTRQAQPLL